MKIRTHNARSTGLCFYDEVVDEWSELGGIDYGKIELVTTENPASQIRSQHVYRISEEVWRRYLEAPYQERDGFWDRQDATQS